MAQSIPISASIQKDHLVCLICGEKYKMMKGHLRLEHRLTPAAYRSLFGLPETYPMMPPGFREFRSKLAKDAARKRKEKFENEGGATADRLDLGEKPTSQGGFLEVAMLFVREDPVTVSVSYRF